MSNNWYVITGGPSTGKTTLLAEIKKQGYETVPEAARLLIDEHIKKGISAAELRHDEKLFQDEIMRLKIQIESVQAPDIITFFDRGMHDSLAYLRHYGFEIADWVEQAIRAAEYKKVFLLDPLPIYSKDYARIEDESFNQYITRLLQEAYAEFGLEPIRVPVLPPKQRAEFVLTHLHQA
jgi:predicted ATPase